MWQQRQWCVRCLLITESPKNPGHYRYLNLGPRLHPLYGIDSKGNLWVFVFGSRTGHIHVPFLVNRVQKSVLLIVQYKFLKSCSADCILQNLTARSCCTGFITQSSWVFHFHPTKQTTIMVGWKCYVPQLYQLRGRRRRGISWGPALKYLIMIHRGGWSTVCYSWQNMHLNLHTHLMNSKKGKEKETKKENNNNKPSNVQTKNSSN